MKSSKINFVLSMALGLTSMMSVNAFAATANKNIDVKATIKPGCFLSADNINFGTLVTPITNQSASSSMRVLCSKATNLSVEMVYGASSGGSAINGTFTATLKGTNTYKIYKDGVEYTKNSFDLGCSATNGIYVYSKEIADLYGITYSSGKWVADKWSMCSGNSINTTTLEGLGVPNQGLLTGVAKGEKIVYSLEVPNNASKVWNSSNKYTFVSTGVEQTVPMKANIKSSENATYRMTPDTYQSILTVVLTY